MKTKIKLNILLASVMMMLASCAVTDFDRTADFNRYRTFAWGDSEIKTENPLYKSDLINSNIKSTVEQEFAKRGITLSERNADFLVSYHTYTEKKQNTTGGTNYYGYPFFGYRYFPFAYGWGYPFGWNNTNRTYDYTEGTLIIDITDKNTNELVWRGSVSGNVDNAANLQKTIAKGIKAIMKKYPVTPQEPVNLNPEKAIG
jgi:hypothetical protein